MKIIVDTDELLAPLKAATIVVEKRTVQPILSNVRLVVTGDVPSLLITATDMERELTTSVPLLIGSEIGSTTVSAFKLLEIVSILDKGSKIEATLIGDSLIVKSGRRRFKLGVLSAQDFPDFVQSESGVKFSLPSEMLEKLLKKAASFMSSESTRYYLNGVFLHTHEEDNSHLRSVATDGNALALIKVDLPDDAHNLPSVIIPAKTVNSVVKLLSSGDVQLCVTQSSIMFRDNNKTIISRVIDGTFPDYMRVIPIDSKNTLTVEKASFTNAIEVASCICTEKSEGVFIKLLEDSAEVGSIVDADSATDVIDAQWDGGDLKFGIQARIAKACLSNIDSETVTIGIDGELSPLVIRGINDASSTFLAMPMRVN